MRRSDDITKIHLPYDTGGDFDASADPHASPIVPDDEPPVAHHKQFVAPIGPSVAPIAAAVASVVPVKVIPPGISTRYATEPDDEPPTDAALITAGEACAISGKSIARFYQAAKQHQWPKTSIPSGRKPHIGYPRGLVLAVLMESPRRPGRPKRLPTA